MAPIRANSEPNTSPDHRLPIGYVLCDVIEHRRLGVEQSTQRFHDRAVVGVVVSKFERARCEFPSWIIDLNRQGQGLTPNPQTRFTLFPCERPNAMNANTKQIEATLRRVIREELHSAQGSERRSVLARDHGMFIGDAALFADFRWKTTLLDTIN